MHLWESRFDLGKQERVSHLERVVHISCVYSIQTNISWLKDDASKNNVDISTTPERSQLEMGIPVAACGLMRLIVLLNKGRGLDFARGLG
jgi:hypothetical protein